VLIGHFGTYGAIITNQLRQVIVSLLHDHPSRKLLLLGRGGDGFAATLCAGFPALAGRVHATGALDPLPLANHLSACDLLVQPYPDGISCRRSSAMAALALGVPVVSCVGPSTEPLWAQSGAVALASSVAIPHIVNATEAVLANGEKSALLRNLGKAFYREHFDLRFTIESLRRLQLA
jgi:glycosyltransferase involved in cell wall biosynthesis